MPKRSTNQSEAKRPFDARKVVGTPQMRGTIENRAVGDELVDTPQSSGCDQGAIFDARRLYRYLLWRRWDADLPRLCFVMLNPSTADEQKNDPTIARCVGFAQRWGYGSLEVVNAFAWRATDSRELKRVKNPVGRKADEYIVEAIERSDKIVVAWGNWGELHERYRELDSLLEGADVSCFGITNRQQPKHPLYLRNDSDLVPYCRS